MTKLASILSRRQKALILLAVDAGLCAPALFLSLVLRLGDPTPFEYFPQGTGLFVALPLIGMGVSWVMGVPFIVLRAFEQNGIVRLGLFAFVMSVICAGLNTGLGFGLPRSIPGIWAALFLVFAVGARILLVRVLERMDAANQKVVLIYGAGATGHQLAAALRSDRAVRVAGFLDDNPALYRVSVAGLRVYPPGDASRVIHASGATQVILAMPTASRVERAESVKRMEGLGLEVMALPSFLDLIDGRALSDQIRPVTADELLGRDAVDLTSAEVSNAYAGQAVMITGAGGSIGSELVRQIAGIGPAKIVLFEMSELALYQIERDLRASAPGTIEIVPVLGSVTDARHVARVLSAHQIDIILHAAAYKHVPMVEHNPLEGARNNVLGTQVLADAAVAARVKRFILVSSDKAVRPTNVMGATKRLAELVIQDRQKHAPQTIFSMVRFGNVLGSSGSVIPLFQEQIAAGGPVTLTHPDVTRYFMTIPEAAQLVLLAGSFATGGEVFVLDMGKSVRIYDLARRMIELSGFTLRDAASPQGDIEIKVTGLRPGEKLFEELLIGTDTVATPHAKILRAQEVDLPPDTLAQVLDRLGAAVRDHDPDALRVLLSQTVDGYAVPQHSLPDAAE
ncbi:MAG: nucleoside-diphosphate sugar epimerase/dehydratase [Pseudomonadota bacterium]